MSLLEDAERKREIREACERFKPGLYVHTKTGNLYRTLFLAAMHDTREPYVVYFSLLRGSLNIRQLRGPDGWWETVGTEPSPDGVTFSQIPRFLFKSNDIDGVEYRAHRELRMLRTLTTLVKGIPVIGKLLAELDREEADIPHASFGALADTVERRAELLLDSKNRGVPIDTKDL